MLAFLFDVSVIPNVFLFTRFMHILDTRLRKNLYIIICMHDINILYYCRIISLINRHFHLQFLRDIQLIFILRTSHYIFQHTFSHPRLKAFKGTG